METQSSPNRWLILAVFGIALLLGVEARPAYIECTEEQAAAENCPAPHLCLGHRGLGSRVETFCIDEVGRNLLLTVGNGLWQQAERNETTTASSLHSRTSTELQRPERDQSFRAPYHRSSMGATLSGLQYSDLSRSPSHHSPLHRLSGVVVSKNPGTQEPLREPGRRLPENRDRSIDTVIDACKACRYINGEVRSNANKAITTDSFCGSDFVLRVRAVSSTRSIISVRVLVVYRLKSLPVVAAPNITNLYIESSQHSNLNAVNTPCDCRNIKPGRDYLVLGTDDFTKTQLTITEQDLFLPWTTRVEKKVKRKVDHCHKILQSRSRQQS